MKKNVIWSGESSPLLFLYEYIFILLAASFVQRTIGGYMLIYAIPGIAYYALKARSMKYIFSDKDIYMSSSLGDPEAITIPLEEIHWIQVVDRHPWKFFRLGTIILVTNPEADAQPCMKCLSEPHELARKIRRRAMALGAPNFPIDTF